MLQITRVVTERSREKQPQMLYVDGLRFLRSCSIVVGFSCTLHPNTNNKSI